MVPSATASSQVIRPVASRRKLSGSVSTTFGGVPRVCDGPASPAGTRSSIAPPRTAAPGLRPNARVAGRPRFRRAYGCSAPERPDGARSAPVREVTGTDRRRAPRPRRSASPGSLRAVTGPRGAPTTDRGSWNGRSSANSSIAARSCSTRIGPECRPSLAAWIP